MCVCVWYAGLSEFCLVSSFIISKTIEMVPALGICLSGSRLNKHVRDCIIVMHFAQNK